jgi:hypothetical protein
MRQDALARRTEPAAEAVSVLPAEASAKADYDALCAALGATARGRAFLDEHARRARQKETALALQALARLEEQLRKRDSESEGTARFHGELRALRSAVISARTNFARFEGMLAKRETVMALFDMLELRITEMLAEAPAEAEPQAANENELLAAAETQATLVAVHAALVTEAPLPSSAPRPNLQVEATIKVDLPKAMAQVESRVPEPPAPTIVALEPRRSLHSGHVEREPGCGDEREKQIVQAPVTPALSEPESFPDEIFAPPPPEPAPPRQQDIIALINALTQAEKIALFS